LDGYFVQVWNFFDADKTFVLPFEVGAFWRQDVFHISIIETCAMAVAIEINQKKEFIRAP